MGQTSLPPAMPPIAQTLTHRQTPHHVKFIFHQIALPKTRHRGHKCTGVDNARVHQQSQNSPRPRVPKRQQNTRETNADAGTPPGNQHNARPRPANTLPHATPLRSRTPAARCGGTCAPVWRAVGLGRQLLYECVCFVVMEILGGCIIVAVCFTRVSRAGSGYRYTQGPCALTERSIFTPPRLVHCL